MSGRETYDISPKQLEAIKWKDARRRIMRERYQNYAYNPNAKGEMVCLTSDIFLPKNFSFQVKIHYFCLFFNFVLVILRIIRLRIVK